MRKIIGITGLKGSGKDTIAKIICENDPSFVTLAFADAVKDVVSAMFGWPRDMLSGRFVESREWREKPDEYWSKAFGFDFTPRRALTTVGTDIVRPTFLKNIWDLNVRKKILDDSIHNFVITDTRFPNEIQMIRELGGSIWRVERGERPEYWNIAERFNKGREISEEEKTILEKIHPSERDWIGIDNPDHVIYNNGTLEDLEKEVVKYLKEME